MSNPIRILFTVPNFITAGSGKAMLNILQRLDRNKFAPAVCVMRKGGSLDKEVEEMGIPFIEAPFTVPARPYLSLPFRAWKAARTFRRYHFELWHSFHYGDDYTEPLIARLSGARAWVYTKKNMNWGARSWHLRTLFAKRVVILNTDMSRDFFAGLALRKTRLVYRGVNTERFSAIAATTDAGSPGSASHSDQFVLGCVAHLVPVKGHPTLLRAIARVPSVQLLIAGQPMEQSYVQILERIVEELGIKDRVRFLGGVTDVSSFLTECDGVVLPTRAPGEGCPVALLEAMSCGKACIATDVPGTRDIIEDGKNGLLVPPEDATALAEAIDRLSSSPELRNSLGIAARKRIEEKFSIEREVAGHEDLYAGIFKRVRVSDLGLLETEFSS